MPKADTPKKKAAKKQEKQTKHYEGNDAIVVINVFAPDYPPQEFTTKIANIRGNAVLPERTPAKVASAVNGGLASKFGQGSIK